MPQPIATRYFDSEVRFPSIDKDEFVPNTKVDIATGEIIRYKDGKPITEVQEVDIQERVYELYRKGESYQDIAKELDVSKATVGRILSQGFDVGEVVKRNPKRGRPSMYKKVEDVDIENIGIENFVHEMEQIESEIASLQERRLRVKKYHELALSISQELGEDSNVLKELYRSYKGEPS